jgi:O-antigen/teichoic acid export membrane protein
MNRRLILRNAAMAMVQVVVLGATLFFLYRYLLRMIGVQSLGLWSVVLATSSASQVLNLGFSASIVRFVAKYTSRNDDDSVSRLIQTALLTVGVLLGLLLLLALPFIPSLLRLFLPEEALHLGVQLLPYALISVWLMGLTSVLTGALDGLQRIHQRSALIMGSSLVYAGSCVLLVERHGLQGLAFAQVIQYGLLLCSSFFTLRRYVHIRVLAWRWDAGLFREMLTYGASFQAIRIANLLCDPITKGLLSRFGGLAPLGYYEMSSKMVQQVRNVIVAANQVLVPVFASIHETDSQRIPSVYIQSYRVVFLVALPLYTLVGILTPAISVLWIGHSEPVFIWGTGLLVLGWCTNALSGPAYFAYMGTGRLRWCTLGHALMATANLILGWAFGRAYGEFGVIFSWSGALMLGSFVITIAYIAENALSWRSTVPSQGVALLVTSGFLTVLAVFIYSADLIGGRLPLQVAILITSYALTMAVVLYRNPDARRLLAWVNRGSVRLPVTQGSDAPPTTHSSSRHA